MQITRGMLDDIVEIFGLNDPDDPTGSRELEDDIEPLQASQIGAAFVDGNAIWDTASPNSVLEEPIRGGDIPTL